MAKLVWRVKPITELEPGIVSETELARIERDDLAVPETLGLTLDEGKRLTAATQAEIVRAQASTVGERFRWCEHGAWPAIICHSPALDHASEKVHDTVQRAKPSWGSAQTLGGSRPS